MTLAFFMLKTYTQLYKTICSLENLEKAFLKARKGKTLKLYVIEFEKDLQRNLFQLRIELLLHTYRPRLLKTFIIRDPKTRKISKSDFRDRIVHHALCNVIEPLFEKRFIYDSYANRVGKGTLNAIERFNVFKRKVSHNNKRVCYVLKADLYHYFDTVDHDCLVSIVQKRIRDERVLWLIRIILSHYTTGNGKGMPLGNLTSQFFANVYLNELDQFVKHKLNVKYYLRYVDDFVLFDVMQERLLWYQREIEQFLQALHLQLHPQKTRIIPLSCGVEFLGFKLFFYYSRIKKKNLMKFQRKLKDSYDLYRCKMISYDKIYDSVEGWVAYARQANTYTLRKKLLEQFEMLFLGEIATKEMPR